MAHDVEPRLEISVERLNPGGTMEVRGVGFEFEETVLLELIGPDIEIPIGEVVADTEGSFLQIVSLPADVREGTYHLRAMTDDHEILSPPLSVQGIPVVSDEGEDEREDEDSLLAPMPTPAAARTAMPPAPLANSPQPASTGSPVVVLIGVIIIGAALAVGWRLWKRP